MVESIGIKIKYHNGFLSCTIYRLYSRGVKKYAAVTTNSQRIFGLGYNKMWFEQRLKEIEKTGKNSSNSMVVSA